MCPGSSAVVEKTLYVEMMRAHPRARNSKASGRARRSSHASSGDGDAVGGAVAAGAGDEGPRDGCLVFFLGRRILRHVRGYDWSKDHYMRATRRGFLTASAGLLAGCAARRTGLPRAAAPATRLARVNVSRDRVIRTIVGLRPFRPSGF